MTNMYPGVPSAKEVSDMQRLLDIMKGSEEAPVSHNRGNQVQNRINESHVAPPSFTPTGRADVDDMKNILHKFYGASGENNVQLNEQVQPTSYYPDAVYEAPKPVAVPTNAWTIRTKVLENASGKQKKTFTIVNQQGAVAASDLNIIEAAQSLQKYLNKGLPVNHPKVQEVLELEESYVRNRQEAIRFKQLHERSTKVNETEAANIFNGRYQTARANALVALEQTRSILDSIR